MTKQQKILLAVVGILLIGVLIFIGRPQSQPKARDDSGDPVSGLVDKDDGLLSAVSTEDFINVQESFKRYFSVQKLPIDTQVIVSNVRTPYREGGEVTFDAKVPSTKETLQIKIDYKQEPVQFMVLNKNYSAPLNGE